MNSYDTIFTTIAEQLFCRTSLGSYFWLFLTFRTTTTLKQPPEVFCKNSVLTNFAKFIGKHMCQILFFWHRCFPVNFAKFLRTRVLRNTSSICFYTAVSELLLKTDALKIFEDAKCEKYCTVQYDHKFFYSFGNDLF